ncbi:hypothetical protein EfmJHP36_31810 (plasmid) [Enterococcus faecium]|nr:hypothetical protein EfmJHP36_31810 [Enterococcus faecium]
MPDYIKDFVQDREDKDQSPRTTLEYLKIKKIDTIILHMPDYIKDFVQDREDKDQSMI